MNGKVHVLYITDMFYGKGGAEKNLYQLVRGLDRSRYSPSVLCIHYGRMLSELRKEGIPCRELRLERVYGFRGLVEAVRLFLFITRNKVKIVVTYHEASDFWGGIISKLAGVPVLISNRRDMGYKLKKHHILIYRMINRFFDRIIVVSEAVRDAVALRQRVLWHKLVTVYNGVETDIIPLSAQERQRLRESLGMAHPDWLVVGTAGSVRSVKGHRFFIEAASIALREFPRTYFLIAGGTDDEQYLRQLQETAKALGVEENLIFCGHKSNILQIIQAMDICVSASLSEGMSNAVLEYMACSRPVVATCVGGNPEVIDDGITGILVPSADALPLAGAIISLLKDGGMRERLGKAGRHAAETGFSITVMLRRTESLYAELLEGSDRQRQLLRHDAALMRRMISVSAKEVIGRGMHYSGITVLLRTAFGRNGLRILAYHRIYDSCFDPLSMCLSLDLFERNLLQIRKNYTPLPLDEGVYLLRQGRSLPANAICLTFDDGYEDNLSRAFPLLMRYKIPATIFVNAGAVEREEHIWHDRIVEAFQRTRCSRVDLRHLGMREYRWSSYRQKMAVCRELVGLCKRAGNEQRPRILDAVADCLRSTDDAGCARLMLNWEEVKYLSSRGIGIGSHAFNHYSLRNMNPELAEYEVQESKRLIRERTGIDAVFFANPFGSPQDFSEDTIALLKMSGYSAAFTLVKGVNTDGTQFALGRYCMSPGMLAGIGGAYSAQVFDMQMSLLHRFPRKSVSRVVQTV